MVTSPHGHLENAPDAMILFDSGGAVRWSNVAAATLFGYAQDSFVGTSMQDLIPERLRDVHRGHHERYKTEPMPAFMGKRPYDLVALRTDGSEFLAEISLAPEGAGSDLSVLAVVRDITPRRSQQIENEIIRLALDSVAEAVYLFDADTFDLWYANAGAVRQTGRTRDELLSGEAFHSFSRPSSGSSLEELLQPLRSGERLLVSFDAIHSHPERKDIEVEILVQRAEVLAFGRNSYIALARDTTARKRQESALAQEVRQRHERDAQLGLAEERERIARRLQDSVIQRLFAVGIRLQATGGHPDRLAVAAEAAIAEIDSCITEVRDTIFTLESR